MGGREEKCGIPLIFLVCSWVYYYREEINLLYLIWKKNMDLLLNLNTHKCLHKEH